MTQGADTAIAKTGWQTGLAWGCAAVASALLLGAGWLLYNNAPDGTLVSEAPGKGWDAIASAGSRGDMIGGHLAAVSGIVSSLLMFSALLLQSVELRMQREDLKQANEDRKEQNQKMAAQISVAQEQVVAMRELALATTEQDRRSNALATAARMGQELAHLEVLIDKLKERVSYRTLELTGQSFSEVAPWMQAAGRSAPQKEFPHRLSADVAASEILIRFVAYMLKAPDTEWRKAQAMHLLVSASIFVPNQDVFVEKIRQTIDLLLGEHDSGVLLEQAILYMSLIRRESQGHSVAYTLEMLRNTSSRLSTGETLLGVGSTRLLTLSRSYCVLRSALSGLIDASYSDASLVAWMSTSMRTSGFGSIVLDEVA